MALLALNATNKPSCGGCALEHDRAGQKTRESGCDMRLFAGGLDGEGESGLPVNRIGGERNEFLVQPCVSNHESRLQLGHCFGGKPTPGGTAGSAFSGLLPEAGIRLGPHSRKCTLGAWESAPLAWLRRV